MLTGSLSEVQFRLRSRNAGCWAKTSGRVLATSARTMAEAFTLRPIFAADLNRLHSAISAIEEIQIHRRLGEGWLREMGLDARATSSAGVIPFSGRRRRFRFDHRPEAFTRLARFKLSVGGHDSERAGAGNALHRDLLPRIHASALGRVPERGIEIEARDAGGRRIHESAECGHRGTHGPAECGPRRVTSAACS